MQVDKSGCKYILSRIDVYLTEYLLAGEIDEKNMLAETLFLRKKDQKRQKKNLIVNLLELIRVKKAIMQTMKLVYKHLSVDLKTDN